MKKRLIFIVFVFALLACTASASYVYAPDKESWQCFTALNTDQILSEGVYSATGETVIWNEMTFIVADLRRVEMYTAEMNRSNHAVQRAGEEYRHVNSRIFYSKGEQHVLGRITLNPGQEGAFHAGVSFEIETTVSGGVDLDVFAANVGSCYSQGYTLGTKLRVENTSDYLRTVALGCVFMVHQYDVYDRWGGYLGRGTVYEPYSVYTYWVN